MKNPDLKNSGPKIIKVLDKGFVRLVGFLGGDSRAVDAARVSFGASAKGAARDKKLIAYLLSHGHLTPFEHSVFQLHVKCPLFVARQWLRHRWGSYNEISARYTEVQDEFYSPECFRVADAANKQGSRPGRLDHAELARDYKACVTACYSSYRKLLAAGVAREMARLLLPVSAYTQFYWTVNARSLMNFISLRADRHAQLEMRLYAQAIVKIFKSEMPWTWAAFSARNPLDCGRKA